MTRKLPSLSPQAQPNAVASVYRTASTAQPRSSKVKKTFIVTGANRGIGLGLAKALAKHGHVIGTTRTLSSADELKAIPNVTVLTLDLLSSSSISSFTSEVTKLAPDGIQILWNNAGMNAAKFDVTSEDGIDSQNWVKELTVNCVGQTELTNALLPLLRKGYEQGEDVDRKIVFTSSICGSVASTSGKGTGVAYFSSKAALNSSVKYWHYQLAQEGFMVTPIHPGWVKSDMGGPDAKLTVEESVSGMLKVVEGLDSKSELKLRQWDGNVLPW